MQNGKQKIVKLIQESLEAVKTKQQYDDTSSGNTYIQIIIAGDSHTHIELPLENSSKKINKK